MPDLDTKLNAIESLASLLDAGAQVLIARVDGKLRIATARQIDDSDVCNLLPNMTLISGLDPENTRLADNMARLQADLESGRYAVSSIAELDMVMQPGGIAEFESFMLDRRQRI